MMRKLVLTAVAMLIALPMDASLFSKQINDSEYAKYKLKSPEFAAADLEMGRAYAELMKMTREAERAKLVQSQREWIVNRDNHAYDSAFKGGDRYLQVLASVTRERAKLFRNVAADERRRIDSIRAAKLKEAELERQAALARVEEERLAALQARREEVVWEQNDRWLLAFMAVTGIGIVILIAGAAKRVVIYYDMADMGASFLAAVLPFAAVALFKAEPFGTESYNIVFQWVAGTVTGLAAIGLFYSNFSTAILHNRNVVLGLFIGTYKIIFSAISIFAALGQIATILDKDKSFREASVAGMILAIIALVARSMINGPEVYEARGWPAFSALAGNDEFSFTKLYCHGKRNFRH